MSECLLSENNLLKNTNENKGKTKDKREWRKERKKKKKVSNSQPNVTKPTQTADKIIPISHNLLLTYKGASVSLPTTTLDHNTRCHAQH